MRIAVTGSGYLATELLKAALESKHEVVAVIQDGRRCKGYQRRLTPFLAGLLARERSAMGLARNHGIPILFIDKMTDDELAPLRDLEPDLILVGGFSIILKKPIIEAPKIGCVNCHSSLLPRHRGPNPFTAVLLQNEKETGVTFHILEEGIDTGPILAQYSFEIKPQDNAATLSKRAADLGAEHLAELLDRIEIEGLNGTPQDPELATYDKKLKKEELFIDWTQSAEQIERMVRACFPYNLARFRYRGRTVFVSKVRCFPGPVNAQPGEVVERRPYVRIATGDGTVELVVGYMVRPVPWVWPRLFKRPAYGDRVE